MFCPNRQKAIRSLLERTNFRLDRKRFCVGNLWPMPQSIIGAWFVVNFENNPSNVTAPRLIKKISNVGGGDSMKMNGSVGAEDLKAKK
jgi:hypothetical protein